MSDTAASLRHKITSAGDLESVVRTMKAMAASSIGQYENAVRSLDEYHRTVQLGLAACFRQNVSVSTKADIREKPGAVGALIFGSDQGLVGQFNELLAEFVFNKLTNLPGEKMVWVVGERIQSRLTETELNPISGFTLPISIKAITPLVRQLLIEMETQREKGKITQVFLFNNRPKSGSIYEPVCQRLLPLDNLWRQNLIATSWPTNNLPEVLKHQRKTLLAFVREYLFVSLFRACAESLASENASRLAAMQRAEKNITELQESLSKEFHRLRQRSIDEELFDVISGFEALTKST
ncbi:F0F1 ATP synthase subunit gamma [Chitinimonas sp. BJB300]|uniref:F0F1 ATP synthase subunit gamma n=1 Tax=Chitinimonas sp. BJB300 TaxID=1559339 RepID=UPI000C0FC1A6|nr:F0F1 ATP synthase subunit gamma [Chitinimonas sp. BJB300]PHV10567.1 F0F1 ATP synthase subunit gamma [Chitinimonas sp. BJB300]TSJ87075.1 F0F1 ATP synthase subunit gamma [Chitinimonas sp. BJB300]